MKNNGKKLNAKHILKKNEAEKNCLKSEKIYHNQHCGFHFSYDFFLFGIMFKVKTTK